MNNPFYVWSEGNRAVKNNLIMNLSNLFVPNLHHEIIYNEPLIKLKEFQDKCLERYEVFYFLQNAITILSFYVLLNKPVRIAWRTDVQFSDPLFSNYFHNKSPISSIKGNTDMMKGSYLGPSFTDNQSIKKGQRADVETRCHEFRHHFDNAI